MITELAVAEHTERTRLTQAALVVSGGPGTGSLEG
jgi:electron transfer flavoprotein alpha subunit